METGLGITAAGVATLRPLLKMFGGGSSAPGHGTSARQWHRTGSKNPEGDDAFDLHDVSGKQRFGVTTIIDYNQKAGTDIENQKNKDNGEGSSDSGSAIDDWNSSQSNLADKVHEQQQQQQLANGSGWNGITVKKQIVQTRS